MVLSSDNAPGLSAKYAAEREKAAEASYSFPSYELARLGISGTNLGTGQQVFDDMHVDSSPIDSRYTPGRKNVASLMSDLEGDDI